MGRVRVFAKSYEVRNDLDFGRQQGEYPPEEHHDFPSDWRSSEENHEEQRSPKSNMVGKAELRILQF